MIGRDATTHAAPETINAAPATISVGHATTPAHEAVDRTNARPGVEDETSVRSESVRRESAQTALVAVGIAIGIAAMIAVLGITASSDAQLQAELDALGPNLLEVTPGESVTGDDVSFPAEAAAMIERIGPVDSAAQMTPVDTSVRRTELIPEGQTGGISVVNKKG